MTPLTRTLQGLAREAAGYSRLAADVPSLVRSLRDVVGFRALRLADLNGDRRLRSVRFKGGTELTYRLNRGDLRTLAETWIVEVYELPVEVRARNIIDLGANIGSTSVWLARRYGATKVVAVEPSPQNARLARINLERNRIDGEVVEAAVAPADGTGRFEVTADSTWGKLADHGLEVRLVSPQSVVDRFPREEQIDLVKIDIEGGEGDILVGDLRWLERVRCLVVELHADRVDTRAIIRRLEDCGFSHLPVTKPNPYEGPSDLMSVFVRPGASKP